MTTHVLSVASEAFPLVKTGGLADVVGALPAAVAAHDVVVTTLIPGYTNVLKAIKKANRLHSWPALMGVEAHLLETSINGQRVLLLDAPELYVRDGGPYLDHNGRDWRDNWRRFAALSKAAAEIGSGAVPGLSFDIVHAHDWQAAMAAAYLRFAPSGMATPRTIVTIHNIAFQGRFDAGVFAELELPDAAWSVDGVEYFEGVGFLKAGLASADAITTVSPTYAEEIREAEFGMGLEGLIAARQSDVRGILNGIDTQIWSPANDVALAAPYKKLLTSARKRNKRAIEHAFGLTRTEGPLFVAVTRLTWQKGMDILVGALDTLVDQGAQLAVLGSGDPEIESAFKAAAERYPGQIGIRCEYDEPLAHLLQGGGDAILIPSRFEPCGLTQLYGLAYGCIPVVARTGGLADTVIDANAAALAAGVATGLQFDLTKPGAMAHVIVRAVNLFNSPRIWRGLQQQAMKADFSWAASGRRYAELYADLRAH